MLAIVVCGMAMFVWLHGVIVSFKALVIIV